MDDSEQSLVLKHKEEWFGFPSPSSSPPSAAASPDLVVSPDRTPSPEDVRATVETLNTLDEGFQDISLEESNNGSHEDNDNDNSDDKDRDNENVDGGLLVKEEKRRKLKYPQRPDAADCSFYLRTGTCRYGQNCRFNHPPRRKNQARRSSSPESVQVTNEKEREKEEQSERAVQQECKYYLRTGGCKFGKACRYNHPREKNMVVPVLDFNFLGLPIRPGERECPYYMRTGSCKYGTNCRFHHPDPTAVGGGDPLPGYHNSGSVSLHSSGASQPATTSWSSPRISNETVPYLDASSSYVMLPPPQGMNPNPDWNGYQSLMYTPERSIHPPPAVVLNNPTNRADISTHHQQQTEEFPERPGQPECSYFMKNGDCKYRSTCKYHHPKNRVPESPACVLSPMGLPLRPDQIICTHYSRYGICKFGPACKFDHPVNNNAPSSTSYVSKPSQQPPSFSNSATVHGVRVTTGCGNGTEALIQQSV